MTIDIDDKFHHGVWQILQKLREERRFTPIREPIEFSIKAAPDLPAPKRQGQILTQLHVWQVIKIANAENEYSNYGGGDMIVSLEILQPKFDGVYGLYENGFIGVKMDAKEFSQKLNKFIHSTVSPSADGYNELFGLWELSKGGSLGVKKTEKPTAISEPSNADKKKLCILEKLKEEWELSPDKVTIPQRKYHQWAEECGITDDYQFNAVLNALKNDGLIHKFSFISNYV